MPRLTLIALKLPNRFITIIHKSPCLTFKYSVRCLTRISYDFASECCYENTIRLYFNVTMEHQTNKKKTCSNISRFIICGNKIFRNVERRIRVHSKPVRGTWTCRINETDEKNQINQIENEFIKIFRDSLSSRKLHAASTKILFITQINKT